MSIQDGYERAALGQMEKVRLVDIIMRQRRQADRDYAEARRQLAEAETFLSGYKAWYAYHERALREAAEAVRLLLGFVRHQHYGCDRKCHEWGNLPAWMKREIEK